MGILDFGFGGFWILGILGFWIWGILDLGILVLIFYSDFGSWGFWVLDLGDFGFWRFWGGPGDVPLGNLVTVPGGSGEARPRGSNPPLVCLWGATSKPTIIWYSWRNKGNWASETRGAGRCDYMSHSLELISRCLRAWFWLLLQHHYPNSRSQTNSIRYSWKRIANCLCKICRNGNQEASFADFWAFKGRSEVRILLQSSPRVFYRGSEAGICSDLPWGPLRNQLYLIELAQKNKSSYRDYCSTSIPVPKSKSRVSNIVGKG